MKVKEIMTRLEAKYSNEKEYLQAVRAVSYTHLDVYKRQENYQHISHWVVTSTFQFE